MINLLVVLIIAGLVFNNYARKYALKNLNYKREISKRIVEAGEEFDITTIVENIKYLPVSFLQIRERIPLALEYKLKTDVRESSLYLTHNITMTLMPFQRVKRTYKVFGKQRGKYPFKEVTLTSGDFLGLNTNSQDIDYLFQDIIVLPQTLPLDEVLQPYGDYNGEISVKRWIIEDPIINVGVREYTGNESQKSIHWPSTLKTGELMVKRYDYTSDNTAVVIINGECNQHIWQNVQIEEIETCFSIARTVMEDFEKQGIPYAISSNIGSIRQYLGGHTTHAGQGNNHLFNILEALGSADYITSMDFNKLLMEIMYQNKNYATYVIITPVVMDQYIETINVLSKNTGKIILISMDEENMEQVNKNVIKMVIKPKSKNDREEVGTP